MGNALLQANKGGKNKWVPDGNKIFEKWKNVHKGNLDSQKRERSKFSTKR